MHVSRPYRAWRWTTIALSLFVLSLLAPAIWQEVRVAPVGVALWGVELEVVEPRMAESLPAPQRMDAYIAPELASDESTDAAPQSGEVVTEEFASRFGRSYAGEIAAARTKLNRPLL